MQYQALLNDVSMQMAMSQLSQRRSQRSNMHSGAQGRRSSRVEKAVINLNSPAVLFRRKTTTAAKGRSASDDNFGWGSVYSDPQQIARANVRGRPRIERPITWHPSSQNFDGLAFVSVPDHSPTYPQPQYPNQPGQHQYLYPAAAWNTPSMQLAQAGYPSIPNTMAPSYFEDQRLDDHHWPWPNTQSREQRMASGTSPPSEMDKVQNFPIFRKPELVGWPALQPVHSVMRSCPRHQMNTQHSAYQAVIDPDEHVQQSGPQHIFSDDKDLVGMGLYDSPEDSSSFDVHLDQYQSFLFSNPCGTAGKGLKLEETWQPPVNGPFDEDDEDGMDRPVDGGYKEYLPNEADTTAVIENLHDYQADLCRENFYFDNYDGTLTNEWLLDHSESIQMQDPGLMGYGSFGRADYQPYTC